MPELRGSLDSVEPDGRVFGWCWSPAEPRTRRLISILLDGRPATSAMADVLRGDLLAAGIGDGGHGFLAEIPRELRRPEPATAVLQDAATGRRLGELAVRWPPEAAIRPPLAGNIDLISRDGWVSGWCWEPAEPTRRLTLDVLIDDTVAGATRADEARADLRQAAVGDGQYGFTFLLPYDLLAERGTVRIAVVEQGTGRPLGEPSLLRIGRRAEQETRLLELERRVTLISGRLDQALRGLARQPEAEARARERLFASVAGFFQDLADGKPADGSPAWIAGETLAGAVAELRRTLPELALRDAAPDAAPDADGRPLATLALLPGTVAEAHAALLALHIAGLDRLADIVLIDPAGVDPRGALLPGLVANLRVGPPAPTAVASLARLLREADTRLVGVLSPRARPDAAWLPELAATLRGDPPAALVGATVRRPDGLLHHAGLLLGEDRCLRDPGRLAPEDLAEHRFLRPVDAVAPLALLADRDRVAAVGGLDPLYDAVAPAVAELCLRLRAAGAAVLCQPVAPVLWAEPDGVAEAAALPEPPAGEDGRRLRLAIARHAAAGWPAAFVGRALVVDAELPVPDRDAGSVAAREQMLVLRRLGWRVTFAAAGGGTARDADRRRLERDGIEVADPAASVLDLLRDLGEELGLIHLYRYRIATPLLPRARELAPRAKIIFSPADLHHVREAREAAVTGSPVALRSAARDQELACARAADATLLHSDHERRVLAAELGPDRLHLLRWIIRPWPDAAPFDGRDGLLFIANFRHAPNVDAVLWYAREVRPLLRRLRPGLVLDVLGADAPAAVRALDGDDIRVRGWVDRLEPALVAARLTIAPLRYGAGFKGKVATSLAAGVPVIGTPIAIEGTGLADGDGVAIAATAETFAAAIARVHDGPAVWGAMSARARERVAALYSPAAADAGFRALLAGLGAPTA